MKLTENDSPSTSQKSVYLEDSEIAVNVLCWDSYHLSVKKVSARPQTDFG